MATLRVLPTLLLLAVCYSSLVSANETLWNNEEFTISRIDTYDYEDGMRIFPIPEFNANLEDTSVSGFSSGSYFANQFHVSYSSFLRGAGLAAGGPFSCVLHYRLVLNCIMDTVPFRLGMTPIYNYVRDINGKQIDDISNVATKKVYIVGNENDDLVNRRVVAKQKEFYDTYSADVKYKTIANAHSFPTDFNARGNAPCGEFQKPYIANCNFDTAGEFLKHIYGPLNARNMGTLGGSWVKFDQKELYPRPRDIGLGKYGYIYVPQACEAGQCRLHIVFHGCRQSVEYNSYGLPFLMNSGYINWADTNNIILAFPQAERVWISLNPTRYPVHVGKILGCWDFMGMYDRDFSNKDGRQIRAIRTLIEKLIGQ